jgi:hypothetical protein
MNVLRFNSFSIVWLPNQSIMFLWFVQLVWRGITSQPVTKLQHQRLFRCIRDTCLESTWVSLYTPIEYHLVPTKQFIFLWFVRLVCWGITWNPTSATISMCFWYMSRVYNECLYIHPFSISWFQPTSPSFWLCFVRLVWWSITFATCHQVCLVTLQPGHQRPGTWVYLWYMSIVYNECLDI